MGPGLEPWIIGFVNCPKSQELIKDMVNNVTWGTFFILFFYKTPKTVSCLKKKQQ